MRPTRLHRLMHGLALVATLALVAVPPLGRVFQAFGAPQAHHAQAASAQVEATPAADPHAHHHMAMADSGHAMPSMAAHAPEPAPAPKPEHQHPRDGDCDYCPLLLSMLGSVAPALAATTALASLAPDADFRSAAFAFRIPTGLGSRGPPALA